MNEFVMRITDKSVVVIGAAGSALSLSNLNSFFGLLAGLLTCILLAWKLCEKIKIRMSNKTKLKETMKILKTPLIPIVLLLGCLCLLTACTTANPHYNPLNPPVDAVTGATNNPAPYIPDQARLDAMAAKIRAGAGVVTPLVGPYGPIVNPLAEGAIGLLSAISILAAYVQKKQKNVAQATNVVMAEGIVKAGATAPVLDIASNTPHYAAVAEHLNNATP